ncbi:myosin-9-like [Orussus abietinus]|uniref:myosin-9-like n=1 Tax=Orussus abietinus TaxID=222816 RepID=UPI0006265A56|nr:myosin-9-like [Orussus abietinus]
MNAIDSAKILESSPAEVTLLKLKYFEDRNTVVQARNANLITENNALNEQLQGEMAKRKELEEKLAILQKGFSEAQKKLEGERNRNTKEEPKIWKDTETTTEGLNHTRDRGIQEWAVCNACQKILEGLGKQEPTVTITKSELENLEKDMQTLRDAMVSREEAWEKAMEREQNYRHHLARLSAEAITSRHLLESRINELKSVTLDLKSKEADLRTIQKEMTILKKIIIKLDNRHRDIEENFDVSHVSNNLSEKDQKVIEDIVHNHLAQKKPKLKTRAHNGECPSIVETFNTQNSPRVTKLLVSERETLSVAKGLH